MSEAPYIDIVLSRGPGPESDFVEVEDSDGVSICIGDWLDRCDGTVSLRIPDPRRIAELERERDEALSEVASLKGYIGERDRGLLDDAYGGTDD